MCVFIYMYVHMYMYVGAHTCHVTWVAVRGQLTIISPLLLPHGYQDQIKESCLTVSTFAIDQSHQPQIGFLQRQQYIS